MKISINKLGRVNLALLVGVLSTFLFSLASPVFASSVDSAYPPDSPGTVCQSLVGIFQNVLDIIALVAGAVFFMMMLVGGFMYMTSAGNPDGTKRAQQTLLWGIVGTMIAVLTVFLVTNLTQELFGVGNLLDIEGKICG